MRKPVYAANWKMFKTRTETSLFLHAFNAAIAHRVDADIIIAPPYTCLAEAINDAGEDVTIAAQNMHFEADGAFTGEISLRMLKDIGCEAVILGHSERRHVFGETDNQINKKIRVAIAGGLTPIFCIGELIEQREANETNAVLEEQMNLGLEGIDRNDVLKLIIAYEPVWAIGTGLTATPQIAQEAHAFIRKHLHKNFSPEAASSIRILYGGSVKPANIAVLMQEPDIDGVLVGGASLDPDSFAAIVNNG